MDLVKFLLKQKEFWIVVIAIALSMLLIFAIQKNVLLPKKNVQEGLLKTDVGAYVDEQLGQARPFKDLDRGHYTILVTLENGLAVCKLNLPTGDIILLVSELPSEVSAGGKYFSNLTAL